MPTDEPPFSPEDNPEVKIEDDGSIVLDQLTSSFIKAIIRNLRYLIVGEILEYLRDCCTEIRSFIRRRNEGDALPEDVDLEYIDYHINGQKSALFMKLLTCFQSYKDAEQWHKWHHAQMDTLAILAQDDKFINNAKDLYENFERSFKMVIDMRLGKRS